MLTLAIPSRTTGSKLLVWKQDPTVKGLKLQRPVYIHSAIEPGPKDSQIKIMNSEISPDENGDFVGYTNIEDINAVHTFAVARQLLTMYERILNRKLVWGWNTLGGNKPLRIYTNAGCDRAENPLFGSYDREGLIKLYWLEGADNQAIYACQSMDLVAHEVSHAIIDAIKPGWMQAGNREVSAIKESFCDISSMFLFLSQLDLVEFIIANTKGCLYDSNNLSMIAEQFSQIINFGKGIRNALNTKKMDEVDFDRSTYGSSLVLTGAIYNIMADHFMLQRNSRIKDDAYALYQTGQCISRLFTKAICHTNLETASFARIAKNMLYQARAYDDIIVFEIIRQNFIDRKILPAQDPSSTW